LKLKKNELENIWETTPVTLENARRPAKTRRRWAVIFGFSVEQH
jgi:hypothetical protein